MEIIYYPKCSTCKKAVDFLSSKHLNFKTRNIKENNPSYEELKLWINKYNIEIKKLFNTSGLIYKNLNLKDKLIHMTDDEKIKLLREDGMLIKRPILLMDNEILIGFKKDLWEQKNFNN